MSRNESIAVLFTSAGRRVRLANCFREDARELGIEPCLLATDLNPKLSAACQVADESFAVSRCTDPAYVPELVSLCRVHHVRLLVPTIDTELQVLADQRAAFEATGVTVAISSPEVVRLARDKQRTAFFLRQHSIAVPRTATLSEFLASPGPWRWPVILKPAGGSSSKGIMVLRESSDMDRLPALSEDYLAQELWEGREYTVNVFFDRAGQLRAAVPHWRIETRTGEVSKGVTQRVPVLMDIAERLGAALPGAYGALCFQAIVTPAGEAVVFEINARFGGGYPLAHAAGARFARWLLEDVAGLPSTAHNNWQENLTMLRYDAAVFVPEGAGSREPEAQSAKGNDQGTQTPNA